MVCCAENKILFIFLFFSHKTGLYYLRHVFNRFYRQDPDLLNWRRSKSYWAFIRHHSVYYWIYINYLRVYYTLVKYKNKRSLIFRLTQNEQLMCYQSRKYFLIWYYEISLYRQKSNTSLNSHRNSYVDSGKVVKHSINICYNCFQHTYYYVKSVR